MIKKFVVWFIYFGLSFLIESFGWTEQGRAFLFLHLGMTILTLVGCIIATLIGAPGLAGKLGHSALYIFIYAAGIAIALFATWGATKLFGVDFFIVYQIMSFGECLCESEKKSK